MCNFQGQVGRYMVDYEHGSVLSFAPPLLILRRMLLPFAYLLAFLF